MRNTILIVDDVNPLLANLIIRATEAIEEVDVIHCRAAAGTSLETAETWAPGKTVSFMYMPAGVTTIKAGFRDKAVKLTVLCDESTADAVQASYDSWRNQFPKQKPFGCFEHEEKAASVWPQRFDWKGEGDAGVYMAAEPSELGAREVNGRVRRSWSPSFLTDADYTRAKEVGGVFEFPDGARGSASNPAKITGIAFCVGTLTNKPAFKNISPVKAKEVAEDGDTVKATWSDAARKASAEARKNADQLGNEAWLASHKAHLASFAMEEPTTTEHHSAAADAHIHAQSMHLKAAHEYDKLMNRGLATSHRSRASEHGTLSSQHVVMQNNPALRGQVGPSAVRGTDAMPADDTVKAADVKAEPPPMTPDAILARAVRVVPVNVVKAIDLEMTTHKILARAKAAARR